MELTLTPLEFALLQTLSLDQTRVWSFAELSRRVWATGFVGDGAQVRAVVAAHVGLGTIGVALLPRLRD